MFDFHPLTADSRCQLGESPVWDDRRNVLWCCDILDCSVLAVDLAAGLTRRWWFPSEVGSVGLAESGRLVIALRHTVGLFDPETGTFSELARIEAERGEATRLNDGKVGPDGAFWIGSMDDAPGPVRQPIGSLYRVDERGEVTKKVEGIKVSNGLAFAPNGQHLFHSDSRGLWVDRWVLDPASGEISGRIRVAELDAATGRPDGAAIDAEGHYWSAGVSAGRLNRFSPEGVLVEAVPVPVAAPTMPCFGGPDLKTMFVTSLIGSSSADDPLAGSILVSGTNVAGAPVSRFRDQQSPV